MGRKGFHAAAYRFALTQLLVCLLQGGCYGFRQSCLGRHETRTATCCTRTEFVVSSRLVAGAGWTSKSSPLAVSSDPVDGDDPEGEQVAESASSAGSGFSISTFAEDISSRLPDNLGDSFNSVASNVMEGEVGSRGEVYFAVQAVVALILLLGDGVVPSVLSAPVRLLFGPVCLLGGLAVVALSILELGDMLSPWPAVVKSSSTGLVKSGPYAQVRHPIYAGAILAAVGFGVASDSAFRLLLSLILWYVYEVKIAYEEEQLVEAFGADYESYKKDVPDKLVPRQLMSQYLPPWTIVD